MSPKRKQPSRVTRSGNAGTTTHLNKVKRRCRSAGSNRQPAAMSRAVLEGQDQTIGTASVSSYTPMVNSTARPTITKTPAQLPVTKTPAKPCSLQLISKYDTDDRICFSVHQHSITGDILAGCEKGVKIISRQSGEITHLDDYPEAMIREHNGEIFISSEDNSTVNVYRFNMNTMTDELLFSYSSSYTPYMSVSDHHVVCRGDDRNVKLYNRVSGTVSTVKLQNLGLGRLQFLPDESLLVTAQTRHNKYSLNKYRLSNKGKATLVWSCDDVDGAAGVSVRDDGLIFVSDMRNNTIYIVSSAGRKIRDITCEEFPKCCIYDISIREDELAVAGNKEGVFVYKIME